MGCRRGELALLPGVKKGTVKLHGRRLTVYEVAPLEEAPAAARRHIPADVSAIWRVRRHEPDRFTVVVNETFTRS